MSKFCLTLLLTGASLLAAAPEPKPLDAQIKAEIDLLRGDVKTMSRNVLAANMGMTAKEAEAFWPIYDQYEKDSYKLADTRVAAVQQYLENFDRMTPELTEAIADKIFKFQADRLALAKTAYGKVAKALTPNTAARFLQIDTALRTIVDLQIQASLPLFK